MTFMFSAEQLDEIGWRSFEGRLAKLLAGVDKDAAVTIHAPAGRAFIEQVCDQALEWGLRTELEIARYVVTAWLLGADFATRFPAMREILESSLPANARAVALERVTLVLLRRLELGRAT